MQGSQEFLYDYHLKCLPKEHHPAALDWQGRMATEYQEVPGTQVSGILYRWLKAAGVHRDNMPDYGLVPGPGRYWAYGGFVGEHNFDHQRVIKRRSDGRLFILSEPYEIYPSVIDRYRALGFNVTVSDDSGWYPGRTKMVLIEDPLPALKEKGSTARTYKSLFRLSDARQFRAFSAYCRETYQASVYGYRNGKYAKLRVQSDQEFTSEQSEKLRTILKDAAARPLFTIGPSHAFCDWIPTDKFLKVSMQCWSVLRPAAVNDPSLRLAESA